MNNNFNASKLASMTTSDRHAHYLKSSKEPTEPNTNLSMDSISGLSPSERGQLYETRRENTALRKAEIARKLQPDLTPLERKQKHIQERLKETGGHEIYKQKFQENAKEIKAEADLKNRLESSSSVATVEVFKEHRAKIESRGGNTEQIDLLFAVWKKDPSSARTAELFDSVSEVSVQLDDRDMQAASELGTQATEIEKQAAIKRLEADKLKPKGEES